MTRIVYRTIQNCRRLHPAAENGWPARHTDVSITSLCACHACQTDFLPLPLTAVNLKMRGTQVTLVIVGRHAFTNGVEVVKPIIPIHAKGHSDVAQMLSRNQIMEYASKDNHDICVDSAHIDSLLPLLQGMQYT